MKFINSKIVTKQIGLAEALAHAKAKPAPRTLDEILADIDAKNKGVVKTAAAEPAKVEKTAEAKVEAPKAEAPKAEAPKAEAPKAEAPKAEKTAAAAPATVKVAELPEALKEHQFKAKDEGEKKEEKEEKKDDEKKPDFLKDKDEKKEEGKKEKEEECAKCADSKPFTLKMAKSLDFRQWAAEDVVLAWNQHGDMDKCMKNVEGLVSDAKVYCALLKTASGEAAKFVKTADKKEEKVAEKQPAAFKKIAKLTDKERAWLAKYYGALYGPEYVDALLADY